MIGYVDTAPTIEPHNGGFLVTFKSGEDETTLMLTLNAMTHLCGRGMHKVKAAQAKQFKPTPFKAGRARGEAKLLPTPSPKAENRGSAG